MNQSVSFGERLREERLRLDLSQAAFGAAGGVTKKTQMLYESGDRSPDSVYLAAIAAAGVDLQYVLLGMRSPKEPQRSGITLHEEDVAVLTPDETALLDSYRHAPPEGKAALKAVCAALEKPKHVKKAG